MGAIGFVSRIFPKLRYSFLVKVNRETGELIRDEKGLCIPCKPGEPGELVGKLGKSYLNSFDGYVDSRSTKRKIISDCLQKEDMAFVSGDILVMDEDGYLYFLDRIGDTFRWKGENVSTGQVENILSKVLNHTSCVVYGVEIPGTEGRAGMASIQGDVRSIDFYDFYESIIRRLPVYAMPLFIRICTDIEDTGTYKLRKVTMQEQGFNPEEIKDFLYMVDHKKRTYVPLTKESYYDIINEKMKL